MKRLLIALATAAAGLVAVTNAQAAVTYETHSALGASIIPGNVDIGNHGDDVTTNVNLPFPVHIYGQTFSTMNVSSNGNIQFTSNSPVFSNTCLPEPSLGEAIMPYWDDLRTDGPGEGIFTAVNGSAPLRQFVVEWRAQNFNGGGVANFEVIFFENTDTIRTIYGPNIGATATVGIQQSATGPSTQFECNADHIDPSERVDYTPVVQVDPPGTPGSLLSTPSALSSAGAGATIPEREGWTASDTPGVHYQLERSVNGGAFQTIATTNDLQASNTVALGSQLQYRVKAIDANGNESDYATGPLFTAQLHQQSDVSFSTGWSNVQVSGASGGSVARTTRSGASATLNYFGKNVALVMTTGAAYGKVQVFVDGVLLKTLDNHRTSGTQLRRINFRKGFPTAGNHQIRIVNLATAGHARADLDAVVVLG